MEERQRYYLGAVALNNAAITLVERGCHHRALAVLQDALHALHVLRTANLTRGKHHGEDHDETGRPAGSTRPQGPAALEANLARASLFVLESAPLGCNITPTALAIKSLVLDMDAPRLWVAGGDFPSVTDMTLIRIDPTPCPDARAGASVEGPPGGCDTDTGGAGLHMETFTMLHNFATVARMHPLSEQELRKNAVRVSRLAYSLAVRFLYGAGTEFDGARRDYADRDPFAAFSTLQLSVLTAQCQYQLCVDLGDCAEAWLALSDYRAVRGALTVEEVQFADLWEWVPALHAKAA